MVYSFNAEGGAEGQRPRPQSQLPERPQRYFRHRRKFRRAEEGERGRTPGLWKRRKDFQARRKRWQRRRAVLARRTRPKRLPPEPNPMSLARALTRLKYASHSVALRLIREGRVQVNDLTVLEPNVRVLVHKDRIVADGVELVFPPVQVYTVIFHKPPHVAASKELGMPTVYDYLPKKRGRLLPMRSAHQSCRWAGDLQHRPALPQSRALAVEPVGEGVPHQSPPPRQEA
jgi:hypothetical protein